MEKKRIAVDVDEVLAKTLPAVIQFHNENYGTDLKPSDFKFDRWYKVWGGDAQDELEKVRLFYKSDYFMNIKPLEKSRETIQELKENYRLFVVTARGQDIASITKDWLESYYPNCFEDVCFGNHYSEDVKPVAKSKICSQKKADFLIEDSPIYANDCVRPDRQILLFDYPWNRGWDLKEGVKRVYSWDDVGEFFRIV